MSIQYSVLGVPGRDNALLVEVDTGHAIHRLLFDCGEGVLDDVSISDTQQLIGPFFSHFHFDHIAGFDRFFRLNCGRPEPIRIFGPPTTREIIHHRMLGVTWNLVSGMPGEVQVTDLDGSAMHRSTYLLGEGFAVEHPRETTGYYSTFLPGDGFSVAAIPLNHGTISMGYRVSESVRQNVDTQAMAQLGLKPGRWVGQIKDPSVSNQTRIDTSAGPQQVGELRQQLLKEQPGDSIAYLTDFMLQDAAAEDRLVEFLDGCQTIVCECSYADADADLAKKNFHMTASAVGRLAARVQPEKLVLFHVSDRYVPDEWLEQLREVRQHFSSAAFPDGWKLGE